MTASLEKTKVDPLEVGWLFVQEYYTFLNKDPSRLHCFYNKKSTFLHGHEGETAVSCIGQSDIHQRILDLGFHDCKVLVSNVDSQASIHGGIIVQVLGEMSNKGSASQKFAQTFFLAEQPNGYYVLNDIFRFLKEDLEDEFEDSETPATGIVASTGTINGHSMVNENGVGQNIQTSAPQKSLDKPKKEVKKVPEQTKPEPVIDSIPKSPIKNTVKEAWSKPAASTVDTPVTVEKEVEVPKKVVPEKVSKTSSSESMKPKTWAIAAGTLASPVVSNPVPAPVAVAAPSKPPSAPAPTKLQMAKSQDGSVSPEKQNSKSPQSAQSQQSNGFHHVTNRRYENRRSSDQGNTDDREKYSIYIKGLQEGVDRKSMMEVFANYGQIVKCDIIPTRNIAFIEFTTTDAPLKIIGTEVIVCGIPLAVEERKRVQYINYYNKKQNFSNNNGQHQNGKGSDSKQHHNRSGSRQRTKKHSSSSPANNGNGKTTPDLSNKA